MTAPRLLPMAAWPLGKQILLLTVFLFGAWMPLACGLPVAFAQEGDDAKAEDMPPPEDVTLTTADGVRLLWRKHGKLKVQTERVSPAGRHAEDSRSTRDLFPYL